MDYSTFHKQIKDALEHLHNAAYLHTHPLLPLMGGEIDAQQTGPQRVRARLKDAIEQLKPPQELASNSPEWRSYLALRYRYLQRMTPANIESELGISQRQLYRELNKGLDALATMLWEQVAPVDRPSKSGFDHQDLENELSRWDLTRQSHDLPNLITDTISTLEPTIGARGIQFKNTMPSDLPLVFVDGTLTRQALFNVLRCAASQARSQVKLEATPKGKQVQVMIQVDDVELDCSGENWRAGELLFGAQGVSLEKIAAGQIVISLPCRTQPRVLIIDDNPAIQQLYHRYLAPHQFEIVHAESGADALRLASETHPDVITLDVMMPNMDGWQVLKALAQDPTTANIPVVVCSVLREPETALSLGARAYLKKPVDRLTLIETLSKLVA